MRQLFHRHLKFFTHHLNSWQKQMHDRSVMETTHNRTLVSCGVFFFAFAVISFRLFDVMVLHSHTKEKVAELDFARKMSIKRADIIDRNGVILATHLITGSVYANPKVIIDSEEAALKLSKLFPDLGYDNLLRKLKSQKGFVWIVRHISPKMQQEVNRLGIPGVYLQSDQRRVYPHGKLVSHVLGYCGIDNEGLGGVEQFFDKQLCKDSQPLQLSIDVRVQHLVKKILEEAMDEFRAVGANAVIMNASTGEILAMVSLPDFDPNLPNQNAVETTFNRNTLMTLECGSVFKIFNTAIALETGKAKLSSLYDARAPFRVGRSAKPITDFKPKNRILSVREVFVYSSNIGSARMALEFGSDVQRQYLGRFGMLSAPKLELYEIGHPTIPKNWSDVTVSRVAFGYGIAVNYLMLLDGVRSVIKGHKRNAMTLLKRSDGISLQDDNGLWVVSPETARQIRELMRGVVTQGAGLADVPGYHVIGKTGTAYKNQGRRGYVDDRNCTFIGAFPEEDPKYILLVGLDSPKPTKNTHGYATAGWTAAPVAGRIIAGFAPLMGIQPDINALGKGNNIVSIMNTVDMTEDEA